MVYDLNENSLMCLKDTKASIVNLYLIIYGRFEGTYGATSVNYGGVKEIQGDYEGYYECCCECFIHLGYVSCPDTYTGQALIAILK